MADEVVRVHRQDKLFTTLEQLMQLVGAVRDERKHVLLFSAGWVKGDTSRLLAEATVQPLRGGASGRATPGKPPTVFTSGSSPCGLVLQRLSIDFDQRVRALLVHANQLNTCIHSVDIGGVRANRSGQGQVDTLRLLAEGTGGTAIVRYKPFAARP